MPFLNRRRALAALAVGVVAPGVLAACSRSGESASPEERDEPAQPQLKYQPAHAAVDVSPTAPVGVDVTDGWFQKVSLTNTDGKLVAGELNRDRTSFTVTEPLGYGASYTWGGTVVGQDGKSVPVTGSFTTIDPDTQVIGGNIATGDAASAIGRGRGAVRGQDAAHPCEHLQEGASRRTAVEQQGSTQASRGQAQ